MFLLIHLFSIIIFSKDILSENILLPLFIMNNQTITSTSSLYLCHVHQLNNSKERFLQAYNIINSGNVGHVHHLLLYECSIKNKLLYSGLCGIYNTRSMPSSVYHYCQTRIIIAWAQGSQINHNYPFDTGLQMAPYTQLLLEIHFETSIPHNQSIGIHLQFYPIDKKPRHEIGVLTLGTLVRSSLFLPPRLNQIRFPTYCFNDCLKYFLGNNLIINIFSILVHAHRHATRIILQDKNFNRFIDQNPFQFHRQEMIYFKQPYLQLNSTNELSLICYYSTRNNYFKIIQGGYDSNDEMCQAFVYYYPKIQSFPLCLSLPIYKIKYKNQIWTHFFNSLIKYELESNLNHLSICGDNIDSNGTVLLKKRYQRSLDDTQQYSSILLLILFLFLSFTMIYLQKKKKILTFFFFSF